MCLAPYFSRNSSTTDETALALVMGAALNSASAPRASTRIEGFWSTFLYHCVSEPCTGRRPFQYEPDRDGDRASGLPAVYAEFDLAVAGEAVFEIIVPRWHVATSERVMNPRLELWINRFVSCTRRSGSRSTNRCRDSSPNANSRRANDLLIPTNTRHARRFRTVHGAVTWAHYATHSQATRQEEIQVVQSHSAQSTTSHPLVTHSSFCLDGVAPRR
jgi:hypothetical protein